MHNSPIDLFVSVVSGLSEADTTRVAVALSGGDRTSLVNGEPGELDVNTLDSGEFAVDLAEHLRGLAESGQRGHTVVQLDPRADTLEVGIVLDTLFGRQSDEESILRLRDLISVASIVSITEVLFGDSHAKSRDEIQLDEWEIGERLARQLEFASVIVLTDLTTELASDTSRDVLSFLARVNPRALVLPIEDCRRILNQRGARPSPRALGKSMGWMLELSGSAGLPTRFSSVGAMVFRDPRPFHPGRLAEIIDHCLEPERVGLIARSRGLIRLATRPDRVGSWSSAGQILNIEPTSMMSWDMDSPAGQELVFFGRDLDHDALTTVLSACLLDNDELLAGPMEWASYADPFPVWQVAHEY